MTGARTYGYTPIGDPLLGRDTEARANAATSCRALLQRQLATGQHNLTDALTYRRACIMAELP